MDKGRRRASAREELRRRAHGLERDEVEELLERIWPEHGLPVPPAHVRPMILDRAMGVTSRLEDARTTIDMIEGTGRWIGGIVRLLRNDGNGEEDSPDDEATEFTIERGDESVEVNLDAGAQSRLTAMANGAVFASRTVTSAKVALREGPSGLIEVWERSAASSARPARLGLIPRSEAEPYRQSLAAATRVGQVAVCQALRMGAPKGDWRLHVYLPLSSDDVHHDGQLPNDEA